MIFIVRIHSEYILAKTVGFTNDLDKEIANKRLSFAQEELEHSHNVIKENERALLDFQNKHKIIHPEAITNTQLEAIQGLRPETNS